MTYSFYRNNTNQYVLLRFKDFNSFVLTYDKLGTIEKASIQNIIHEYLNLIKCFYLVFILRNLDYRWLSRKALKTNLLLKSNSTQFSSIVLVIIWYAYLITRLYCNIWKDDQFLGACAPEITFNLQNISKTRYIKLAVDITNNWEE